MLLTKKAGAAAPVGAPSAESTLSTTDATGADARGLGALTAGAGFCGTAALGCATSVEVSETGCGTTVLDVAAVAGICLSRFGLLSVVRAPETTAVGVLRSADVVDDGAAAGPADASDASVAVRAAGALAAFGLFEESLLAEVPVSAVATPHPTSIAAPTPMANAPATSHLGWPAIDNRLLIDVAVDANRRSSA